MASVFDDGECGCCGARLKVLGLNAAERARVRSALMKLDAESRNAVILGPQEKADETRQRDNFIVTSEKGVSRTRQAGGGRDVGSARGNLEHFAQWLEGRRRGVREDFGGGNHLVPIFSYERGTVRTAPLSV